MEKFSRKSKKKWKPQRIPYLINKVCINTFEEKKIFLLAEKAEKREAHQVEAAGGSLLID